MPVGDVFFADRAEMSNAQTLPARDLYRRTLGFRDTASRGEMGSRAALIPLLGGGATSVSRDPVGPADLPCIANGVYLIDAASGNGNFARALIYTVQRGSLAGNRIVKVQSQAGNWVGIATIRKNLKVTVWPGVAARHRLTVNPNAVAVYMGQFIWSCVMEDEYDADVVSLQEHYCNRCNSELEDFFRAPFCSSACAYGTDDDEEEEEFSEPNSPQTAMPNSTAAVTLHFDTSNVTAALREVAVAADRVAQAIPHVRRMLTHHTDCSFNGDGETCDCGFRDQRNSDTARLHHEECAFLVSDGLRLCNCGVAPPRLPDRPTRIRHRPAPMVLDMGEDDEEEVVDGSQYARVQRQRSQPLMSQVTPTIIR